MAHGTHWGVLVRAVALWAVQHFESDPTKTPLVFIFVSPTFPSITLALFPILRKFKNWGTHHLISHNFCGVALARTSFRLEDTEA